MNPPPAPAAPARPDFLARRWRGLLPLRTLLWREMLGWGTAINIACSGVALGLLAAGAPPALAVGLHFAPVPWNLFLVAAVWRHRHCRLGGRVVSGLWLVLMTLV